MYKIIAKNFHLGSTYCIHLVDDNGKVLVKVPLKLLSLNDNKTIKACHKKMFKDLTSYLTSNPDAKQSFTYYKNIISVIVYISREPVDVLDYDYLIDSLKKEKGK